MTPLFEPKNLPLSVTNNDHPATRDHFPHLVRTRTGFPVALFWQKEKAEAYIAEVNRAGLAPALVEYAEAEIKRLGLGDTPTNCHGVVAHPVADGVRLSDGVGLNRVCRTRDEVDAELTAMAEWYAEAARDAAG